MPIHNRYQSCIIFEYMEYGPDPCNGPPAQSGEEGRVTR